jgi:tetratricopeptide (TPR) repeat protein
MLSSTFTDLRGHRERAIEAISKLGYVPRVMEHSGAQAEADVIDTSLQMVRDAVAYIGVISFKYGQSPFDAVRNPDRLSITELEFNEARRLGRPIVLFIMGDEHAVKKADVESEPDKRKKLDDFRERAKLVRSDGEVQRVYETFNDLEEFSQAAAIAIGNLVRRLDRLEPPERAESEKADRKPQATISNIPITLPRHFLGRDDDLAAIDEALRIGEGRAAIAALHGLRGVGKTTLAVVYARRHQERYRATWWIRAETQVTLRADLVGLGVQMGWVAVDAAEEAGVAEVINRLSSEGEGILLIYDNARNPNELDRFLQREGGAHIIVTSNAPNWSRIAVRVEIEVWSKETGADFLMAWTGRDAERDAALALSEALGGLPFAHEQAAAYCERTGVSLTEYRNRLAATPVIILNPHDGLTVAKTFALAIDEAAKQHPAAEPLIVRAALLAPEPIPLFLFAEGREIFGGPFGSAIAGNGLDEAVAALRAFALVDREPIPDERDPAVTTDSLRLHRLVREVAAARCEGAVRDELRRELLQVMVGAYPSAVLNDPRVWLRARRLDALALAMVGGDNVPLAGLEEPTSDLMDRLAFFRQALAAYAQARKLFDRAMSIREAAFGKEHAKTAKSWNNLGDLCEAQGDAANALRYYQGALSIRKRTLGDEDRDTAESYNNVGFELQAKGDLAHARQHYEKALEIRERLLGVEHPETALSYNNLGYLLRAQGNFAKAREYYERALRIKERALGEDHMSTAISLNNLGYLLRLQGDLQGARSHCKRALWIYCRALGPDHPETAKAFDNLGLIYRSQRKFKNASVMCKNALKVLQKTLGAQHPATLTSARNTISALKYLGRFDEAEQLGKRYGLNETWFSRFEKVIFRTLAD